MNLAVICDEGQLGTRPDVGRGNGRFTRVSFWPSAPRMDPNRRTIGLFREGFSGAPRQARPGATCPNSSANGIASTVSPALDPVGPWEHIMASVNESWIVPNGLPMIHSTVVRTPHQAAGANGGLRDRVFAVQGVVSRPGSTSASTAQAYPRDLTSCRVRHPTIWASIWSRTTTCPSRAPAGSSRL